MLKRILSFRSARTGRYVTANDAHANQDTTVSETSIAPHLWVPPEVMRAVRKSIRVNGIDNTLERLVD